MINLAKSKDGVWLTSKGVKSHFKINENWACPCCGQDETDARLVDNLETLRSQIGKPILINNVVRCKEQNKKDGGSPRSNHLPITTAVDCACKMDIGDFGREAVKLFNGIGLYKGKYGFYAHLDLRPVKLYWFRDKFKEYHYFKDFEKCLDTFREVVK